MLDTNNTSTTEGLVNILYDSQPDAVMWFVPKFSDNPGEPVDFRFAYCNAAASYFLKDSKEAIIGSLLSTTSLLDEESKKEVFEQCRQVWTSNSNIEFTYFSSKLNRHLNVQRSKVNAGILSITRDHTQLEKAKVQQQHQAELLNKLISNAPYGVSLYESIRSESGEITDFRLRICNQKSAEITAFTMEELYKYTVKELMIIRGQSNYFDMCRKVVETGESIYLEHFAAPRNKWIGFSIVKFDDGYLLNYIDITETKALERQAHKQAETLEAVLNASITGLFALEPIIGFTGKVIDFKFTLFNKTGEALLGLKPEDKLKTYLTLFPASKANGLFDMHCEVLKTGKPMVRNVTYKDERNEGDYLVSILKMGENEVVQSFTDLRNSNKIIG